MTKNITFSDDEALEYIRNLENPNKVGWDGKVWRTPKQKGYDRNQIAYGLDIREKHNPLVYNYLKSKNRLNDPWLTDREAKSLMAQTFAQKKDSITKAVAIANGNVSQMGYNRLAGMAWHGHPMKMLLDKDSITGKAYRSEIANGGVDFDNTFDAYYSYGDNAVRFKDRTALDYKYRPQYIINGDTRKLIMPANYTKLLNYEPQWKYDSKSYNTIYPVTGKTETPESLSSWKGAGAPNITPRVPDILEVNNKAQNDPYILTFNRFAAKPIHSPFALDLSLPSLDSLMLINSPLRLLELYFADALGVSDMMPQWPSLFPRFKCGKLPRFGDGTPADTTWHQNWLNNRLLQFDLNNSVINGEDSVQKQLTNLSNTVEYDEFDMDPMLSGRHYDNEIHYNRSRLNLLVRDKTGESDDDIRIHERTHALYPRAQEAAIDNIVNEWNSNKDNTPVTRLGYEGNSKERYAFLMLNRHALGLDPSYRVTLDDIKNWRSSGKIVGAFNNTPDELLLRFFNEIAYNLPNISKDGMLYAANGKSPVLPRFKDGKSPIHIKPENRGKLTRLKKRTGKSEAELYNDGNPAHKKMVVFARNARKFRH